MKLRIYAVVVTLVLIAVLTNPSEELHYAKLRQFYPSWVDECLLNGAKLKLWHLSPPTEQEGHAPYDQYDSTGNLSRVLNYTSLGFFSIVKTEELWRPCGLSFGPRWPISIGFLGYVFAKRPPKSLNEEDYTAEQGQTKTYSFRGQGSLDTPDESGTNAMSFRIQGPMMIDTPPRRKDALYKMQSLE